MSIDRRKFLQLGGMSLAMTVAGSAEASRRFDSTRLRRNGGGPVLTPRPKSQRDVKTMVMIFLRGGADGLNQTIPTEAGEYSLYKNEYRPTIGVDIADINSAGTRLLDGSGVDTGFALNPTMVDLMPLWEAGQLAVLPDVHYANASRSHFDGQLFYESGVPGVGYSTQGWMNRYLDSTNVGQDPTLRGLALSSITPASLSGPYPNLAISSLNFLSVTGNEQRNDEFLTEQALAYRAIQSGSKEYDLGVGNAGESLINAIRAIEAADLPDTTAAAAALYPDSSFPGVGQYAYFGQKLADLAKLMKSDQFGIEIAQVDLNSWDHHSDMLSDYHNHPTLSQTLARGIAGFVEDLGPEFMANTVITVMTEFGRTTRENGSIGTDHGSATSVFVVGDPDVVNGRQVIHGPTGWAGLDDLRNNRDLKYSTDYRDVFGDVLRNHLGAPDPELFPGHEYSSPGVID